MTVPAAVITCSDTSSRDPDQDRSGPLVVELLVAAGYDDPTLAVVPDNVGDIGVAVSGAVAAGAQLVVCTGGTGLGPRDVTPEAIVALGARPVPGIGEAFRAASRASVPTADLSRTGAWTLERALVIALPGSPGGVRDGWAVLEPLVDHALDMMSGGGHATPPPAALRERAFSEPLRTVGEWVTADHLDPLVITAEVYRSDAGAVVTFEGRVRDHDHDRTVTALTYEGHRQADEVLRRTVAEAAGHPGVLAATARHRVGNLAIGDLAFFVAVAAAHRDEAFAACSWVVDTAKERLPIWKHQTFADGTSEWVNCP
ncbi:MAG: molybdenum cofactor biosynthesis protein MoaE [Candidatus Nanopelagicales bacterium]